MALTREQIWGQTQGNVSNLFGNLGTMAGASMGIPSAIKAQAINEGSYDKINDLAKEWQYLKNDPELLKQVIETNDYLQKKPFGRKYLNYLLFGSETFPTVSPKTLSPDERSMYEGQRGQALFGAMPTGGQPFAAGAPGIQQRAAQALTPHMAGMGYPTQKYSPTGTSPEQGQDFWKQIQGAFGVKAPATASAAAQARVGGMEMPEVPTNYNEWVKGAQTRFGEIGNDKEKSLAGFLTMGPITFQNIPGETATSILESYPELAADTALQDKLGITRTPIKDKKGNIVRYDLDLSNWDNTAFEARGWEEKLNAYLHLITALDLDAKTREWIFFNWFGGGQAEPARMKREWSSLFGGMGKPTYG